MRKTSQSGSTVRRALPSRRPSPEFDGKTLVPGGRGLLCVLRKDGIDFIEQRLLLRVGEKRNPNRGPRKFGDTGCVQTKKLRGDVVFPRQGGVEHRWIVRGDGEWYSCLVEPPHRMLGQGPHRPGAQVRRRAHLQRNMIGR